MKKDALLTLSLIAVGTLLAVAARSQAPYEVSAADLEAAGMTDVRAVDAADDRFRAPVRYFRVAPEGEATAKDCADCGDLVAVFVGESASTPAWIENAADPVRLVGSRYQVRRWIEKAGLVVIVTGPGLEASGALSDLLVARFTP